MGRRAVEPARDILPGEDVDHPGHSLGAVAPNMDNARVGVRRAQHLEVQEPLDGHIHGIARPAGDDCLGERVRQARAAGPARDVIFGGGNAGKRIGD